MTDNDTYEIVIGLEVHAQLLTKSKLFCGDSTSFNALPNTNVSPFTLAHPGTLPELNKKAIELSVVLGQALHCNIQQHNYFARKNYFYPDLPKGYQVSQHTAPVCKNGYLTITTKDGIKNVKLNRIHLEEDAGKSIHDIDENYTCIDFNRAGVPLLEIVTEPDLHSSEEAFTFLTELRKILRWLNVCDGNMEEGSMRCDANISVRLKGDSLLGKRVEVKNLNSIRNVKKAIEIEAQRLIEISKRKEAIVQETRSFDADNNTTFSLRSKEEADDYRYFPEPDLPPFYISEEYIQQIAAALPLLPEQLKQKYMTDFSLSVYDAASICSDKEDAAFFESLVTYTPHYKAAANWLLGPVRFYCNENNIPVASFPLSHASLAELISITESGKVNFTNASTKILHAYILQPSKTPLQIAEALGLLQESNVNAMDKWVQQVITALPEKVKEYKQGKKGLMSMFAGEVKKLSNGKADMQLVNRILAEKLNS